MRWRHSISRLRPRNAYGSKTHIARIKSSVTPPPTPELRSMPQALSTPLAARLDYAGLFPPAGLDMPQAVAEYERHRVNDRLGMLANFVCPVARLEELSRNATGKTWSLSVLATNAESPAAALEHLAQDLTRIAS